MQLYVSLKSKTNHEELLNKLAVNRYINHKKNGFLNWPKAIKS